MSVELVKRDDNADVIGVAKLGDIFAKSGYFRDVRDQAQAVVKILYGRELGFSPVVSMMGIHVIEGKPSLSSNLLGTLVKRSGKYDYRVKESTDKVCVLEFREKGETLGFSTFSMEDAQRANLVKPGSGWAKYPRAMMFARALSAGVRLHCPDVSACPLYVPEELGATVDEEGAVVELPKSARPVEVTEKDIEIGSAQQRASTDAEPIPTVQSAAPLLTPELIEPGQAVNFERSFKEALKEPYRNKAKELSHQWLKAQGIVDATNKPTAKAILKKNYFDVRSEAIAYAAAYTE